MTLLSTFVMIPLRTTHGALRLLWLASDRVRMAKSLLRLRTSETGTTAIEYGLIAALISTALIATLTLVGADLQLIFNGVSDTVTEGIGSKI